MENNNNFWQSERGKALIKLGAWFIFIIALIVFVVVSENNSSYNEEEDIPKENEGENVNPEPTYEFALFNDMINNLLNSNYEYEYNVTNNEITYIYNGVKCNNVDLGYKETSEGIIKYYQNENNTYQVILDEYLPITNLYEGIDTSFIDLDVLFDNLSEYLYNTVKNEDTREITYNKDGYQVTVTTNLEEITHISVITDIGTYNLSFNAVDTCDIEVLSE